MSDQPPDQPQQRASRTVKLVLMGVAGAALLYSCAPAVGSAVGLWPGIWFLGNPFYRGSSYVGGTTPGTTTGARPADAAKPGTTTSQRGGFGGSGAAHGGGSSS
jgi:hypothetical protein